MIHHIYCLVRVIHVATPIRHRRKCKIEPLVIINISSHINPQRMLCVCMCVWCQMLLNYSIILLLQKKKKTLLLCFLYKFSGILNGVKSSFPTTQSALHYMHFEWQRLPCKVPTCSSGGVSIVHSHTHAHRSRSNLGFRILPKARYLTLTCGLEEPGIEPPIF